MASGTAQATAAAQGPGSKTSTAANSSNLQYDPDFWRIIAPFGSIKPPEPTNVRALRATTDTAVATTLGVYPLPSSVAETKLSFLARDNTTLTITRFSTDLAVPNGPAAIYLHEGGTVCGSVPIVKQDIVKYAFATNIPFFAVSYRLAPEHPYPTAVEDAYAALEWLRDHAGEQHVDPARIALWGASAGGLLGCAVALMARDRGFSPPIAKQILIYPMLDDRTELAPDHPLTEFLTWTVRSNKIAWDAYLGAGKRASADVSPYAAPGRAEHVAGLPKTYIDVGGLDLFKDECIAMAARLAKANVEVEFHLYPGVSHAWDYMAQEISVTRRAVENRVSALKSI